MNEFTNLTFFKETLPFESSSQNFFSKNLDLSLPTYLPEKLELLWMEFRRSGRNSNTICIDKIPTVKEENYQR